MRLILRTVCPDSRIFRPDGERLRHAIERAWRDDDVVEVDFEGQTIASVSFLDEAVAVLFVDHDAEVIRRRLKLTGLTEGDRRELNTLVAKRRAQRLAA